MFAKDEGLNVIEDQTEVSKDRCRRERESGCCRWYTRPLSVGELAFGFQMRRDVVKLDVDWVAGP